MRSERWLPRAFLVLLLAVMALAGWQWRHGAPLSANLMELVPGDTPDALELSAEQRMQEPLNREMLVLVASADRQQAIASAQQLGEQWQASGLFEKVQWDLQADLPALREQLLRGRLAMLSNADRTQLIEHPEAFIQQRVQALFDPFTGFSLVPSQDDWLGLTGRIQKQPAATRCGATGHWQRRPDCRCRRQKLGAVARPYARQCIRYEAASAGRRTARTEP